MERNNCMARTVNGEVCFALNCGPQVGDSQPPEVGVTVTGTGVGERTSRKKVFQTEVG